MQGDVLPRARVDGLVSRKLADETLVYDQERHEAHCLNETASLVWSRCDGKTTVGKMAKILEGEFGAAIDVDVVWLAIEQLQRFHLIEKEEDSKVHPPALSRRKLILKYAPAALALPLVISIVAPTAAGTSSCPGFGDACDQNTPCCPGLSCDFSNGTCTEGTFE